MVSIQFVIFLYFLQQNYQEQFEAYKHETKALRSELDQVRTDHPYYVGGSGGADADDKVDDDPVHRQQRARDWPATDDPSKVSLLDIDRCHNVYSFPEVIPCLISDVRLCCSCHVLLYMCFSLFIFDSRNVIRSLSVCVKMQDHLLAAVFSLHFHPLFFGY